MNIQLRLGEKLYIACDFIMRIAIVNALWCVFTVLGLGIFGIGPATVALFAVVRKWIILSNKEFKISKEFWKQYKKNFLSGNMLTIIFLGTSTVLFMVLRFYQLTPGEVYSAISYVVLLLMLICLLVSFYIFPIFVNYSTSIKKCLKNAFIMTFANPVQTILMIIISLLIYTIGINIPGLLVFFGVGVFSYNITWLANQTFKKLEIQN